MTLAILPVVALRGVNAPLSPGSTQWIGYLASFQGQAHTSDDFVFGVAKSGPTIGESWALLAAVSQPYWLIVRASRLLFKRSDLNRGDGNAHDGPADPRGA
eukprot:103471-Pyramimonas_sp.AAC.1